MDNNSSNINNALTVNIDGQPQAQGYIFDMSRLHQRLGMIKNYEKKI
jgi:hypothetical protein